MQNTRQRRGVFTLELSFLKDKSPFILGVYAACILAFIPLEHTLGNLVPIMFGLPVLCTAWFFGFRPWAGGHLPLSGGSKWTIN